MRPARETAVTLLAAVTIGCHAQSPTARLGRQASSRVDVRTFGAVGDGRADDTRALQQALAAACAANGGVVYVPPGRYRYSRTLRFVGEGCSNVVFAGDGPSSTLEFASSGGNQDTFDDRALYIESNVSPEYPIADQIKVGDRTFRAVDTQAAGQLRPGEWLVISERDPGAREIVAIDWAQVLAVHDGKIEVQHPFRTSFPASRRWQRGQSGLAFFAVGSLLENLTIRDLRIVHAAGVRSLPLVNVGMALRTTLTGLVLDNGRGNGLALYRAKDVTVRDVFVTNSSEQANEIAACVDVRVTGSSFGAEYSSQARRAPAADTAALDIDFGSAFFTVTGNSFHAAGNIGVMLLDGVHDGVFSGNVIGWVRDVSIGLGQGLTARGAQRILFHGNVFAGGDRGAGNTCISFADSTQLAGPIPSAGNVIQANICAGFVNETGPRLRADHYF